MLHSSDLTVLYGGLKAIESVSITVAEDELIDDSHHDFGRAHITGNEFHRQFEHFA